MKGADVSSTTLQTITKALGSTGTEPFFYSAMARRLDQQQREDVRRGFMALVSAGDIEIGVWVGLHADGNNREYRFTDGSRSLKRYRLAANADLDMKGDA